jgi:glycosyltransferase involved in cell wall biosynthesis
VVQIYGLRANLIGRIAARVAGIKVVTTAVLSTDDWRRWYHVACDRATSWAVDEWIANSTACKRSLLQREAVAPRRVRVIYDGIDGAHWQRSAIPASVRRGVREGFGFDETNIVCITVANLHPAKGLQFLIDAAATVLDLVPHVRFLFVGQDHMNGQLQAKCRELGIDRAVVFAGFQSDIRSLLAASEIAVLPSLREGLPISLMEAMSMSLPVVATRVSGIPELVSQDVGYLVNEGDPAALIEPIVALSRDEELRRRHGEAARSRITSHFTIERMLRELTAEYARLLAQKSGPMS